MHPPPLKLNNISERRASRVNLSKQSPRTSLKISGDSGVGGGKWGNSFSSTTDNNIS